MTATTTSVRDVFRFSQPVDREPYPYILQDSLLPEDMYQGLIDTLPPLEDFGKAFRMHGDLTYGDPAYMRLISEVDAWQRLHEAIHSEDFMTLTVELFREEIQNEVERGQLNFNLDNYVYTGFIEGRDIQKQVKERDKQMANSDEQCELYTRLDIGYGLEGYGVIGGGGGIHIDNASRLFSMLIYMCDQADFEGGGFNFHVIRNKKPEIVKTVDLKHNRSLISLQNNRGFHSVNEITRCSKPRFAMYIAVASKERLWTRIRDNEAAVLSQNRDPNRKEAPKKPSLFRRGLNRIARTIKGKQQR